MLHKLIVGDFKSFGGTHEIPLAPLTLVYGPNSAGKSSLIQSVLALRQLLEPAMGTSVGQSDISHHLNGNLVRLGPPSDVVHRNHKRGWAGSMSLGVEFSSDFSLFGTPEDMLLSRWLFSEAADARALGVVLSYRIDEVLDIETMTPRHPFVLSAAEYRFLRTRRPPILLHLLREWTEDENPILKWHPPTHAELAAFLRWIHATWHSAQDGSKTIFSTLADPALREGLEQLVNLVHAGTVDSIIQDVHSAAVLCPRPEEPPSLLPTSPEVYAFSRILQWFLANLRAKLHEIAYLGPIRTAPPRVVSMADSYRTGINTPFPSGESMFRSFCSIDNSHEEPLDAWLKKLDIPHVFRVRPLSDIDQLPYFEDEDPLGYECYFESPSLGGHLSPSAVGFGIGQLLPILICGIVADHPTIIVEQPEIHLHPKQQGHLADFFLETEPQWIIETHSEALMLRIQRRIREGKIRPEDVTVLYVEPTPEGSQVLRLRLDEDGEFIDEWPNGFFEERFEDIFGGSSE